MENPEPLEEKDPLAEYFEAVRKLVDLAVQATTKESQAIWSYWHKWKRDTAEAAEIVRNLQEQLEVEDWNRE